MKRKNFKNGKFQAVARVESIQWFFGYVKIWKLSEIKGQMLKKSKECKKKKLKKSIILK